MDTRAIRESPLHVGRSSTRAVFLPFAHRNRTFYEALARDLGYELDEFEVGPGELLF